MWFEFHLMQILKYSSAISLEKSGYVQVLDKVPEFFTNIF